MGVSLFDVQFGFLYLLSLALLIVKVFALVNSLAYPDEAYRAADKLNKAAWTAILGVSVVIDLILGWGWLMIVSTVGALVSLADVRPALREGISHRR